VAELDYEQVSVLLPQYLNPTERRDLFEELKRFPSKIAFYDVSSRYRDELLQGDGWRGFVALDFHTAEKKMVSAIIISNSCDIAVANRRDLDPNILFAPIIRLARFRDALSEAGKDDTYIGNKLDSIRRQQVTSIFYLPQLAGVIEESLVNLDDIHGHPLSDFVRGDRTKLFTLTQAAFYIFIIKLSLHFTRIQEGVHRFIPPAPAGPTGAAVPESS
jgi:hypothetical protein